MLSKQLYCGALLPRVIVGATTQQQDVAMRPLARAIVPSLACTIVQLHAESTERVPLKRTN